jgi:hypothetical protein
MLGLLVSQFRFVRRGRLLLRALQWHPQDSWDCMGDPFGEIPTCRGDEDLSLVVEEEPPSTQGCSPGGTQPYGQSLADVTYQGLLDPHELQLMINRLEMRVCQVGSDTPQSW